MTPAPTVRPWNLLRGLSSVFLARRLSLGALLLLAPLVSLGAEETSAPAPELAPPADLASPPATATREDDGLAYAILSAGDGEDRPQGEDLVKVHYTGWDLDGEVIDSSIQRGRPTVLPLKVLIPGWRQGVEGMSLGEKRRLWIPAELAWKGQEGRPQGDVVFDVELLEILRVPETPADVAAPPADAQTSKSGLAWKVLRPGTGTKSPSKTGLVRVHYTGWTTDGERFDSSLGRGQPSSFSLNKVIKGWTEGLQDMVEGEVRRFWVPKKLAYRGKPDLPFGMLVFDIELIEVVRE